MTFTITLYILAVVLVAVGIAGLVLPVVPAVPIVYAGLLLAAWAEHFQHVGTWTLVILALMAVLAYGVDFLAGAVGTKQFGGTKRAVVGAVIGSIVGIFFGIIGIIVGPFAGAVIAELTGRRSLKEATRAGVGTSWGLVLGVAAKLAIVFAMVGIFVMVRFMS